MNARIFGFIDLFGSRSLEIPNTFVSYLSKLHVCLFCMDGSVIRNVPFGMARTNARVLNHSLSPWRRNIAARWSVPLLLVGRRVRKSGSQECRTMGGELVCARPSPSVCAAALTWLCESHGAQGVIAPRGRPTSASVPERGFASMIRTFPSLMDPPQVHPPISHDACRPPAREIKHYVSLARSHPRRPPQRTDLDPNAHGNLLHARSITAFDFGAFHTPLFEKHKC
jgi:hypothetical protein